MNDKTRIPYVAATGALSYMIADIVHEVVGHAGMGLILGNKITRLTSVYFKSVPGSVLVDIGGPTANLIFGSVLFFISRKTSTAKLFLFQVAVYNLFWFCGTIVHSALSKTGDWTFALHGIVAASWSISILVTSGLLCYALVFKLLSSHLTTAIHNNQHSVVTQLDIAVAFLFASLASTTAGLFFAPDRLHAALEGLLEMAAVVPILFLKFQKHTSPRSTLLKPNRVLPLTAAVLYILFCFTLGKGFCNTP